MFFFVCVFPSKFFTGFEVAKYQYTSHGGYVHLKDISTFSIPNYSTKNLIRIYHYMNQLTFLFWKMGWFPFNYCVLKYKMGFELISHWFSYFKVILGLKIQLTLKIGATAQLYCKFEMKLINALRPRSLLI